MCSIGAKPSMRLDLDNVEGGAGEYRVEVKSEGVNVTGNAAPQTVRLDAKQRNAVSVPITSPSAGVSNLTVRVSGPNGYTMERGYVLGVQPATQIMPIPDSAGRRTLFFEPDGPGFVRLTVMDGRGASDSVVVRLQ